MLNQSIVDLTIKPVGDNLPIRNTGLDLLDLDRVAQHVERAGRNQRYDGPRDPLAYLMHRECLIETDEGLLATTAGILCFGRNPQATFPRAVVDLGHYHGVEPVSFELFHLESGIRGSLFDQIDRVESYLWSNIHHGATVGGDGARRIDIHEYPQIVLRELTVNMIAHREYHNFLSAARVQMFRNRIEWITPGGLPPGVTIANLLTAQASRNPTIVRILFDVGYIEAFGQGLDTVVTVLRREGMLPAEFDDAGAFFQVTVAGRPAESLYDGRYGILTDRQRRILAVLRIRGGASQREITESFDGVTERSIQRDLKDLVEGGFIINIGQKKSSRYQLDEKHR